MSMNILYTILHQTYIIIFDGILVLNYRLSLNLPRYQQFEYVKKNIYNSILNMDRYDKIDGIFGGDSCKNSFVRFKN